MPSNQYDSFVPGQYIRTPFESYLQAGNMEQQGYNQDKAKLEDIQDKLAAIKKRQIDIPGVNAITDEYLGKGLDLLENNKFYSPDMSNEVRRLARTALKDPRLEAAQYMYQQELQDKELEKQLKAQGKLYQRHTDNYNKPLFDSTGKQVWTDYQNTGLGNEALLNHYGKAQELTKGIVPKLKDMGITLDDKNITYVDKKTGQTRSIPRTFMNEGQRRQLDPNAQWVLNEVDKVLEPFMSSGEGQQYSDMVGKNFDKNTNTQQERYSGFGEQAKTAYQKDKARELVLSTIKPVDEVQMQHHDVTGTLGLAGANGGGGGTNVKDSVTSPVLTAAYNTESLGAPDRNAIVANPEQFIPSQAKYANLTPKQKRDLYTYFNSQYEDYAKRKAHQMTQYTPQQIKKWGIKLENRDEWAEIQGSTKDNPYGKLFKDFAKDLNNSSEERANAMTAQYYKSPLPMNELAKDKIPSLTSSTITIVDGKYSGHTAEELLGKSNINNYHMESSGNIVKYPTKYGGTQPMYVYNMYVPKDKAEEAGISVDETERLTGENYLYTDADGNKQPTYKIEVAVPTKNIVNRRDARTYDAKFYDKDVKPEQEYDAHEPLLQLMSDYEYYGYDTKQNDDGSLYATYKDKEGKVKRLTVEGKQNFDPNEFYTILQQIKQTHP